MATPARSYAHGATYLLGRRTVERTMRFAPRRMAEIDVSQAWFYALARTLVRYPGIRVVVTVLMCNHHHTVVTVYFGCVGAFMRDLHSEFAKAMSTFLSWEGYGERQIWDSREASVIRLVDAGSQAFAITYSVNNTLDAGLVADASDWPQLHRPGTRRVVKVPRVAGKNLYFGKDAAPTLTLASELPPELVDACGGVDGAQAYLRKAEREDAARIARARAELGFGAPMGVAACGRLHPDSQPRTEPEPKGQPKKAVWASDRKLEGECALELMRFRGGRLEVVRGHADRETPTLMPYGSCALPGGPDVGVALPLADALVLKPMHQERARAIREGAARPRVEAAGELPELSALGDALEKFRADDEDQASHEEVVIGAVAVVDTKSEPLREVSAREPMNAQRDVDAKRMAVLRARIERPETTPWRADLDSDPEHDT